ncbi:hypothetical protein Ahy_A06g027498 [Arachis hypogaea]|uniref:Uncharacterized protein n=1 Tax=Arachis hypogaea TaxID=3818 RepID=A0A445CNV3_ARAHY|nr:hypothetical protein Ahy_A06g027498 [Arachis hypogaea]
MYTMGTISQDHDKLDSDTIADVIKPLVEVDPSIKVKPIIAKIQSKFNYTINYRNAWFVKQKSIAKFFYDWEVSYRILSAIIGQNRSTTKTTKDLKNRMLIP